MKPRNVLLISILILGLLACSKDTDKQKVYSGELDFKIAHAVDGNVFNKDTLQYLNLSGNQYLISNIQWFLSNIELVNVKGLVIKPANADGIYYVDSDLPESGTISLTDLPVGDYSEIRFTFGLDETTNTSYRFVNSPESFMFWPEYLGGGYHYMKLNGKWLDKDGSLAPFNFHLGIGQIPWEKSTGTNVFFEFGKSHAYKNCEGFTPPYILPKVNQFVQNYFTVAQNVQFKIVAGSKSVIKLDMQIEKWFDGTYRFDHDYWGGSIMQQQQAQVIARENGKQVFRFSVEN